MPSNHVRFHNFDLNALRFVASVVGHWGVFNERRANAWARPTVRIQARARELVDVHVTVQQAQQPVPVQNENDDGWGEKEEAVVQQGEYDEQEVDRRRRRNDLE
jgi:hypothetical protein